MTNPIADTIIIFISTVAGLFLLTFVMSLRQSIPHSPAPEQTDAERAEAGENAMWAELGRVK